MGDPIPPTDHLESQIEAQRAHVAALERRWREGPRGARDDSSSGTSAKPDVPDHVVAKWQRIVDLLAKLSDTPAALVMRVDPSEIEVFVTSAGERNPYGKGERHELNAGLYCETVISERKGLTVRDARKDVNWDKNPDLKINMSFYIGYPLVWKDGEIFGTICVLDEKDNATAIRYRDLIREFRGVVETDLHLLEEEQRRKRDEGALQSARDELQRMIAERTRRLAEGERFIQGMIATVPGAAFVHDLENRSLTHVMGDVERTIGYSSDELLAMGGDVLERIIWPADLPAVRREIEEKWSSARDDENVHMEFRLKTKEGRCRWMLAVGSVLKRAPDGRVAQAIGTLTDITDQKRIQKDLEVSMEALRGILETSRDWIWATDQQGVHTYCNAAVEGILGYRPEELIGKPSLDFLHPDDRKVIELALPRWRDERRGWNSLMLRWRHKAGGYRYLESNAVPALGAGGEFQGFRGVDRDVTDRREAQEALRRERDRAQEYLDIANVMFVALRADQTVSLANKKTCEILGYESDEILGKNWFDCFLPGRDRERTKQLFVALLSGEIEMTSRFENPVLTGNGEERLIAWHNTVLRDDAGKVVATLSSGVDITEQRRAEEALRESEEKYRLVSENIPVAVYSALPDELSSTVLVTSQIEELTGYSSRQMLDEPGLWSEILYPDDRERVLKELEECRRTRSVLDIEYRIITKDGCTKWIRDRATFTQGDGGEIIRTDGYIEDISERKEMERGLAEAEASLLAAIEQSPSGVLIADAPDVRIRLANPAALRIIGATDAPLIDIPVERHAESWQIFRSDETPFRPEDQPLSRAILRGETSENVEVVIRRADGEKRWVLANAAPIRDADGEITSGILVFTDITPRIRAQEELQNAMSEIRKLKELLEAENIYLRGEIQMAHLHGDMVGQSEAMRLVLAQAEEVADTGSTVLLLGETGTGKELLARAIHRMSSRRKHPLVIVNCAAMPSTLVESELFGREKGAFTGALTKQRGRFEIADGGTIFLDEIGELTPEIQAKILRVLQEGQFERLGSTDSISVDVRVIAATNRDLEKEIREGRFREDLFYRLNVFPITIPPLRERPEDIRPLVWDFVNEFSKTMGKRIDSISQRSLNALREYSWPGNVRELRNVIERAMIRAKGTSLHVQAPERGAAPILEGRTLAGVERQHILDVLKQKRWRIRGKGGAAEALGLKPSTLESRMKKLDIERPR